jgi:hypothetical protein
LQGSVFEVIDQASRDAVAMDGLQKVAVREMLAFEGAQPEKPVKQAFFVANCHLGCRRWDAGEKAGTNQQGGERLVAQA